MVSAPESFAGAVYILSFRGDIESLIRIQIQPWLVSEVSWVRSPVRARVKRQLIDVSLTSMFLPLSLCLCVSLSFSPPSSLSESNEKMSLGEDLKKKEYRFFKKEYMV